MIYRDVEFHNVVAMEERPGFPGVQLQRLPRAVRDTLNDRGRWNSQGTCHTEIRFVTESPQFRIWISALWGDTDVFVWRGNFRVSRHYLEPGGPLCIHEHEPPHFALVKPGVLDHPRFAGNVWRICLNGYHVIFHDLETFGYPVRPPTAEELPRRRWVAYGSSITAGTGASLMHGSYIQHAARLLDSDVCNLGMGGACHCEPALADHIAGRDDWQFCVFELGVNMRGWCPTDEFKRRADYFVRTVAAAHPDKPIFLITAFPNNIDHEPKPTEQSKRQAEYDGHLRTFAGGNIHVVEGKQMLTDFSGLSADLCHPDDFGMIQMGQNLAAAIAPVLG